jgi:NADH:ubiquinone oxidoreductase subunit K
MENLAYLAWQRTLVPIIGASAPSERERDYFVVVGNVTESTPYDETISRFGYFAITDTSRCEPRANQDIFYAKVDYRHPDRDPPPTVSQWIDAQWPDTGRVFNRITFGQTWDAYQASLPLPPPPPPPGPTATLLTHSLSGAAGVTVQVGVRDAAIVSAKLVLANGNTQATYAAQDAGVVAAVAALVGASVATVEASVGLAIGVATYSFTADVAGQYAFGGVALANGTPSVVSRFTVASDKWGGSTAPTPLICGTKPAGSTVTFASLVSSTPPGSITAAWLAALANNAPSVPGVDPDVAALTLNGWVQS